MGWRRGGWRGGLARRVKGIKRMKHGVKKGGRGAVKGHTRGFISEKGCKDCSRATTPAQRFLANSRPYCSIIIRLMPRKLSRRAVGGGGGGGGGRRLSYIVVQFNRTV